MFIGSHGPNLIEISLFYLSRLNRAGEIQVEVGQDSQVSLCLADRGGISLSSVQTVYIKLIVQLLRHRVCHQSLAMMSEESLSSVVMIRLSSDPD